MQKKAVIAGFSSVNRFAELIRRDGYTVKVFDFGIATLSSLTSEEPDLIIIFDFSLSDMDNYELFEKISEILPNRKAPIMFMYAGEIGPDTRPDPVTWSEDRSSVMLPRFIGDLETLIF